MPRIIAGALKGLELAVPPATTRPTSSRVREAIFSSLEHRGYIDECAVLDLFAGSGAFGIEALSRGASQVVWVEQAPKAAAVLKKNVRFAHSRLAKAAPSGAHPSVEALTLSAEKFLDTEPNSRFDTVFIDPPYAYEGAKLTELLAKLERHLTSDALVLIERAKRSEEFTWPAFLTPEDCRTWGDTRVWTAVMAQ